MALQEDARLLAVSSLSGSHGTLVPELMRLLHERGGGGVPVVGGGALPPGPRPAPPGRAARGAPGRAWAAARPEVRNARDPATIRELDAVLATLEEDEALLAVGLTGGGDEGFVSGGGLT